MVGLVHRRRGLADETYEEIPDQGFQGRSAFRDVVFFHAVRVGLQFVDLLGELLGNFVS